MIHMYIYVPIIAFVITVVLAKIFIPELKKLKIGQNIRGEGPKSHQKKQGTPTMGGIIFIIGLILTELYYMLSGNATSKLFFTLMFGSFGFGVIGFLDDYIKLYQKRSLGLKPLQKLAGQLFVATSVAILIYLNKNIDNGIKIPFMKDFLNIGIFLIPFNIFIMLATSNAINLTDGLDGLATGVCIIIFSCISYFADKLGMFGNAQFALALAGALAAFLIFNRYPAKVMMGDTGSLFLGGALSILVISMGLQFYMVIFAIVPVIETLSVILQVSSYKLRRKRIFLMSPLHHHFEMKGMKEVNIVRLFYLISLIFSILAILIYKGV